MIRYIEKVGMSILLGCLILIVLLRYAGIVPYIVVSGSMEPEILTGSVCFINTKWDYDAIKEMDIIAFRQNDQLVTHRVIKKYEKGFETKGDHNDVSDGITTTKMNYYGKNICAIPYLGYVLFFMSQRHVRCIFLSVCLLFLVHQRVLKKACL